MSWPERISLDNRQISFDNRERIVARAAPDIVTFSRSIHTNSYDTKKDLRINVRNGNLQVTDRLFSGDTIVDIVTLDLNQTGADVRFWFVNNCLHFVAVDKDNGKEYRYNLHKETIQIVIRLDNVLEIRKKNCEYID